MPLQVTPFACSTQRVVPLPRRWRAALAALAIGVAVSVSLPVAPAAPVVVYRDAWSAQAARVEITRDGWGIAHVHGRSDADAVFGMVYAQAEDDFNRIETNFLTNLGRLAEVEGEARLWQDLRQRLFVDPDTLRADYAASPAWLKALMDAWADGLNYFLATHPEVRPRLLTHFEPWMALSFSEGSIGGDISKVALSQLQAFHEREPRSLTALEQHVSLREPGGSNGFAIAPARTRDGHALLLINPHTSFFFRSELQMRSDEGLNAYGAVTWGQFFIYQGFNEHVGWMHTTSGVDNVDEFAETIVALPDGTPGYRHGDEVRALTRRQLVLRVRNGDGRVVERSFQTYASHHGPIVREEDGRWIAVALMNRPLQALQQSFLRTKARDYAGFMQVAALQANSSNNTVYADTEGRVALLFPQFVPIRRAGVDYRHPVDGSDPRNDWQGLHALDSLPQVVAPDNGWLFNTNNAPWTAAGADSPRAADFPAYMDQAGDNPRAAQAIRVLGRQDDFTPQALIAAAHDPHLSAFARLLPTLLSAYDALPAGDAMRARLADPIAVLRDWNVAWGLDSVATTLAVSWGDTLWEQAVAPAKAADVAVWDYLATRTPDAERLAALAAVVDRLTQDFGAWRVPWGEINRYQRNDGAIHQDFDDARPSLPVAFAPLKWGSLAAFESARGAGTKRRYGTSGNSFVAVVEFGPQPRAWAVSTGGESGDPASPHFADQAQRYLDGDLRPVHFDVADVAAHAQRRYRPGERGR